MGSAILGAVVLILAAIGMFAAAMALLFSADDPEEDRRDDVA